MVKKFAFILILSISGKIEGLTQSYNFINYDISDGLAHDRVTDICEDQFGNLWLATAGGGLSKFNGITFENYTIKNGLESNYVRDILNDKRGNIWAATAEGISKLDGFHIKNFHSDTTKTTDNSINVIFEATDGDIYFSAPGGGLGKIDINDSIAILDIKGLIPTDRIIDIDEDSEGNIWFVSAIRGLYKLEANKAMLMLDNSVFKGYLLSIEQDTNDQFWVGTNKGLLKYNAQNIASDSLLLENVFVKAMESIDSTTYWLVTATGAIKVVGEDNFSFGQREGLTNKGITSIIQDREGTVWFGSDGDGLFKLATESFLFFGEEHGLTNLPITTIITDSEGDIWLGSFGNGLSTYNGKSFTDINQNGALNYITCSTKGTDGTLWFGTRSSGIYEYKNKTFKNYTTADGLVYDATRQLYIDKNSNLWIGAVNGLSKYDGTRFINFTKQNGLADNVIWGISEYKEDGVLIVTRSGFHVYKNDSIENLKLPVTLFDNRINTAIYSEKEVLWIGYSGHGVARIAGDSINYYTTSDGLSSDLIYSIIEHDGDLLIGNERGVDRIVLNEKSEVKRIKKYGRVEGFKDLQTTYGAVLKEGDKRVWYGNDKGVFLYNSINEKVNKVEPLVYIKDFNLVYENNNLEDYRMKLKSWLHIPENVELNYSDNNIVIEYFGSSLRNPYEVKYKYRLIGLEGGKWSESTSRREVVYTNLKPNEYKFEVIASNSDGVWSANPAVYKFVITPPIWQRWWFYVLSAALVAGLFKTFYDYRVRVKLNKFLTLEKIRNEEQQKVRKRMARDFHDNLGNQLASISVYVNLINLKLKSKSEEIDSLLTNIQKHTNSLFSGTKDFIWTMDPDSDELNEIYTYIKDFGEDLFEKSPINFYASADGLTNSKIPLPSGWSRQLVLIFKEAMTNVLKHSGASKVELSLTSIGDAFEIILQDNGSGIKEGVKKGMGMKSMKNRAKEINSTLEVESNNNGTKIRFRTQVNVVN
ncbi:MAG: two-component regulator propeller domain-containing protein [Fulvivirga sp.]|uniref:ligand-binding sensor domain-containing protein n=1 Tax=Fulvivirga sp. TaxID=1931237 RepID=UPI0032EFD67E